ncbi:hypothetical protein AB1N83_014234 [Pleurotus pulmonarius]
MIPPPPVLLLIRPTRAFVEAEKVSIGVYSISYLTRRQRSSSVCSGAVLVCVQWQHVTDVPYIYLPPKTSPNAPTSHLERQARRMAQIKLYIKVLRATGLACDSKIGRLPNGNVKISLNDDSESKKLRRKVAKRTTSPTRAQRLQFSFDSMDSMVAFELLDEAPQRLIES